MMKKKTAKGLKLENYKVELYWSELDGLWVAEVPQIPFCTGDGSSPTEALKALGTTFEILKEEYNDFETPMPLPTSLLTTEKLKEMKTLFSLAELAKESNLNINTLKSKLKHNRPLHSSESKRMQEVLKKHGLAICG